MKNSFVVLLLLLVCACTTNINKLSLIVPDENPNWNVEDLNNAKVKKNAEVKAQTFILVFIPLGYPNFGALVDKMLLENNGQALINATITDKTEWYVLFGFNKVELKADVVLKK